MMKQINKVSGITSSQKMTLSSASKLLSLACKTECFIQSKDKLWNVKDHIETKNEDFFKASEFTKKINTDTKNAFNKYINLCGSIYPKINETEKDKLWSTLQDMISHIKNYNDVLESNGLVSHTAMKHRL